MTHDKKQIELYQDAFNFLLDGDHELVVYGVLKKLYIRRDNPYYDDLVQEGMVAFVEKYIQAIGLNKEPDSYLVFIYQGVYWYLLDYLRKEMRHRAGIEEPDDKTNLMEELEDKKKSVGYYDTHILSDELMKQLTSDETRYLTLAYDYGMNISEIARECEASRTTVYQWRRGVIKKFQK
ncbi:sigma-70 family RNA polymerase sigma factor [Lentilactobacillus sunkii]|uniref:Sigma-70 family RNA polymerase sigma factor n=1 Tax=Lentilactobacillus sunkii DSM 19904 TaxID=1423808 RepID=A0A0R1KXE9_9LACO|nr:sigma-70 family RNA polymerase sigma factor [Lentilactobacillus sunkii]KRK88000.1 sigma-70 family RNA polymerase sigma factor [Lentilactobacillus sunkii DSM 19904]